MLGLMLFPATMVGLGVAAIVVSQDYKENDCQQVDLIGINLSDWFLGYGCATLANGCIMATLILSALYCFRHKAEIFSPIMIAFMVIFGMFLFIYTVIGVVILFRSSLECFLDGTTIGVFVFIVTVHPLLQCLFLRASSGSNE